MSNLGKPKPHTAKQIRERREKVLLLMAKGYNQSDIAKELHTTRNTVMRDLKEINEWTKKGLYDLAKQTLPTMYYSCIIEINEAEKEAWKIYRNPDNDPEINQWHRIAALRVLIDINKSKFKMFQDGPAFMEIKRLEGEMERLKQEVDKGNSYVFRPGQPRNYEEAMRLHKMEEHKRNCNLPHIEPLTEDKISKTELERLGVPYEIAMKEEQKQDITENEDEDNDEDPTKNN